MEQAIKCVRCKIDISSKRFSGCDDCSDEYEDEQGVHLCGNCCSLYSNLQSNLYADFLDNKVHMDTECRAYYHQPERSKREDDAR